MDYLKNQGVSKLDYVIGTHPHSDHIGGLDDVINSFEVGKVIMPKVTHTTKTFEDDTSPAVINACAIEMDAFSQGAFPGYGQALDFTLNIGTLGMKDFETKALSVYPVPTQDVLNIKYKSPLNVVKIYNTVGQEVFAQNVDSSELQIDLSTLNSGAYIVRLFAEEGQHTFRIVKQ